LDFLRLKLIYFNVEGREYKVIVNKYEIEKFDTIGFTDATKDYLKIIDGLKDFSKGTISSYRTDFNQFKEFLERQKIGSLNVAIITPGHIEDFCLELLKERRLHINSVHRKKDSLSSFFRHCVKRGWILRNPVEQVEIARKKKNVRKVFLDEQDIREFILSTVTVKGYDAQTLRAVKMTLCFTGMRNSEIRKLNWEHIDLDKNLIKIFDSKNTNKKSNPDNLDREVPICSSLRDALVGMKSDTGPVFKNIKGIRITKDAVKGLVDRSSKCIKTKISITPHCMRHNFSSHLEKNGATLSDIALALGHRPDGTTSGYIHSNLNRIQKLIEKFSKNIIESNLDENWVKTEEDFVQLKPRDELISKQDKNPWYEKQSDDSCNKQEQRNITIDPKKINEAEVIWNQLNGDQCMPANFLLGYLLSPNNL